MSSLIEKKPLRLLNNFTEFTKSQLTIPNSGSYVSIADSNGDLLIGGDFASFNFVSNSRLAKMKKDGTPDVSFMNNSSLGVKFNSIIYSIEIQSDGKILVVGSFTNYAGTSGRSYFIRLNSDGTTDTSFCSNATDGSKFNATVNIVRLQSDGKILVGGNFTNYAGTSGRSYFIRLNSDGTTDTTFCSNATDGTKFSEGIDSISIQSDGKILVGGRFLSYAGTSGRHSFIRLNSDGTTDTSFCSNASDGNKINAAITSVAIQSDGKIIAVGNFVNYAGTSGRNRLIRLNSDGTLDSAFTSNSSDSSKFNAQIQNAVIQSDGKLLVGGSFTNYAGTTGRNYFIRLNSDGTTDTTFCSNATDGSKFSAAIRSSYIYDNNIIVLGFFNSPNRRLITILNDDGTTSKLNKFVNSYGVVISCSVLNSNNLFIGGAFLDFKNTPNLNRFIKILPNGEPDTTFNSNASAGNKFNSTISSIVVQSDGKVLVSGNPTNYAGTTGRDRFIRLNSDGTTDTTFCANASDGAKFNTNVLNINLQSDGKILVGGNFTNYAGTTGRDRFIRLNSDGTTDTSFCSNATDGTKFNNIISENCVVIQSDGKIVVGGSFTDYAGTTGRNRLIRLNSDGTLDTSFCSNASDGTKINAAITSVAIQSDGKILVGGNFTNYAGTTGRDRFIRLNSDGTTDTSFCSNATDGSKFSTTVNRLFIHSNGKILVGGAFTNYAGTSGRSYLIQLNSDGTLNTTFCNNISDLNTLGQATAAGIAELPDSNIFIPFNTNNNLKQNSKRKYKYKNAIVVDPNTGVIIETN